MKGLKLKAVALVIILTIGFILSAGTALAGPQKGAVARIKADFDAAMARPLEDRITSLESLEQNIDDAIFKGALTGEAKTEGLYYKFHAQRQSAKYPQSANSYALYIRSIKESRGIETAQSTFLCNLTRWKRQSNHAYCALVCNVMATEFADEPEVAATALYHLALCKFNMNGTMEQCVEVCNKLISEHLESRFRPEAMRMLANAYIAMGKHDDALGTLALLKEQYPNTLWEHYADMRPAMVYEFGKGRPQKALEIYQRSLARYKDHMYGPYIQKQIVRLQKIIEEQLILDALDGIAAADKPDCDTKSLIVKVKPREYKQVAAKF